MPEPGHEETSEDAIMSAWSSLHDAKVRRWRLRKLANQISNGERGPDLLGADIMRSMGAKKS